MSQRGSGPRRSRLTAPAAGPGRDQPQPTLPGAVPQRLWEVPGDPHAQVSGPFEGQAPPLPPGHVEDRCTGVVDGSGPGELLAAGRGEQVTQLRVRASQFSAAAWEDLAMAVAASPRFGVPFSRRSRTARRGSMAVRQYSSGRSTVVADRSASVITQIRVWSASRYAERIRSSPQTTAQSLVAWSSSVEFTQSPVTWRCR